MGQVCDLKPGLSCLQDHTPTHHAVLLLSQKLIFISFQLGFGEEIRNMRLIFYSVSSR